MSKKEVSSRVKTHTIYRNSQGKRLKGATTIIDEELGWGKRHLINWANNLGLEGIESSKYKDETAQIGNLTHAKIKGLMNGTEVDTSAYTAEEISLAEISFNKFLMWFNNRVICPVFIEEPLVSEIHQYGGTPDFYGHINGKLTLADWKTGNNLYLEHWIQLAGAYQILVEEYDYPIEEILLLNIPRTSLTPLQEQYIPLDKWAVCEKIFMNCLHNNQLKKQLSYKAY